jgi:hypothetical protein
MKRHTRSLVWDVRHSRTEDDLWYTYMLLPAGVIGQHLGLELGSSCGPGRGGLPDRVAHKPPHEVDTDT